MIEQIPLGFTAIGGVAVLMWATHMAVLAKTHENVSRDSAHFSRNVARYVSQIDKNEGHIKAGVKKVQKIAKIKEDDIYRELYRQAFIYPPFAPELTKTKVNSVIGDVVVGSMKFRRNIEGRRDMHDTAKRVGKALKLSEKDVQELSTKKVNAS